MPRSTPLLLALLAAPAFAQHEHHAGHDHAGHGATAATPEPPRLFLDKSPRVVQYQLDRLDDARLLAAERSTDDPKFAPVYAAILTRPGVSAKDRAAALAGLVALNGSDAATELLRAFDGLSGEDPGDRRAAGQLTELLLSQGPDALAARADALAAATRGDGGPVRVAGFAGLIAAGEADAAWTRAQVNHDTLRDWLAAVPLVPAAEAPAAQRDRITGLIDAAPSPAVARAAIDALAAVPTDRADTFARLAPRLADPEVRRAVVRTLLSVPPADRDPAASAAAAAELVQLAETTAPADRTTDDFLNAMQLADGLLARLPADRARPLRERLRAVTVRVVRIETVEEEMRYDTAYFAVEAGRPVQIVLDNEDLMPHNLVVTAPGKLREVAEAGLAVGPEGGASGKQYVPDGPDVLEATDLVDARRSARLTFTAPSEPGEYPYVCTFPRHWMRMYGVMVVVPDLDAWLADPTVPADPIGNTRTFVRSWTVGDLVGDGGAEGLGNKLRGRSPEIGARLFAEATCAQCHRAEGEAGLVGPSLAGVFGRWDGDGAKVLREILEPSAHVDPKYAVRTALLEDGRVVSGLVVAEDADTLSILVNPEAKQPEVLRKDAILDLARADVSLMPKALLDRFTEDEIFELLAYLRGLETPATSPPVPPEEVKVSPPDRIPAGR